MFVKMVLLYFLSKKLRNNYFYNFGIIYLEKKIFIFIVYLIYIYIYYIFNYLFN